MLEVKDWLAWMYQMMIWMTPRCKLSFKKVMTNKTLLKEYFERKHACMWSDQRHACWTCMLIILTFEGALWTYLFEAGTLASVDRRWRKQRVWPRRTLAELWSRSSTHGDGGDNRDGDRDGSGRRQTTRTRENFVGFWWDFCGILCGDFVCC